METTTDQTTTDPTIDRTATELATRDLDTLYISKDEAAAILGISPRRVLEYVQAGAVHHIKQRDPVSRQITTRICAGDVEKLREEREYPAPLPSQPSQEIARQVREGKRSQAVAPLAGEVNQPQSLIVSLLQGLVGELRDGVREGLSEGLADHSWPLPLYLPTWDAVRYTGLGAGYLRAAAKDGRVAKVGRKYRRCDLDKL